MNPSSTPISTGPKELPSWAERRVATYRRNRYMVLFYSLLFSLVMIPIFSAMGSGRILLELLLATNLLAAAVPIHHRSTRFIVFVVLVIATITQLASQSLRRWALFEGSMMVWTLIATLAACHALRFSLRATKVDSEHVYAALSAYLLAGMFLGTLYFVLESISPGALLMNGQPIPNLSVSSAVYFSFVTLATLGYGDIVPGNDVTRGIAVLEAIAGQLYLAVMIARLVSLYVTRRDGRGDGL